MTKITKIAAITALLSASASASAFWGGPGVGSWGDEFFGDGWGDFNMNMSGGGYGRGRGYGYGRHYPYYGGWGGPYGGYGGPWGGYGGGPYGGYGGPYGGYGGYPYAAPMVVPQAPAAESK